jgi:hypothetical protein
MHGALSLRRFLALTCFLLLTLPAAHAMPAAQCEHALSGSRSPLRPTLNRRAGRTTGAAAPARWCMRRRSAHLLVNA